MTSDRIQELFFIFGKLIKFDQTGVAAASGVRSVLTATHEQLAAETNDPDPYKELSEFLHPFIGNARNVTAALGNAPLVARAGVESYLRSIGPELFAAPSDPPATILTSLAAEMQARSQSVAPSGVVFKYFRDGWNVNLPQNASPTIGDDIITTAIL